MIDPPCNILFSPLADEALEALFLYTMERWGIAQAESYRKALEDALEGLAAFPLSGVALSQWPGLRMLPAGHHRIVYRHRKQVIEVVLILHQAADMRAHVKSALQRAKNPLNH